jgi:hypothetical protein
MKGSNMFKPVLMGLLLVVILTLIPGCKDSNSEETVNPAVGVTTSEVSGKPEGSEIPVNTEFGRMLGYIPYSFLEENDIYFDNWMKAKQLHGYEDIKSIEAIKAILEDQRENVNAFLTEVTGNRWRSLELEPVIGFDIMTVDRMVFTGVIPPRSFTLAEGDFDEELIISKLSGLGYTETAHGTHSYYKSGEDYEMDPTSELGKIVLNSMNDIAVFDNTIMAAPAGKFVTGMFDTRDGQVPSVIDNAACRALADSLGDIITGVITVPERIIQTDLKMQGMPKFDFTVPEDWGILHQYEMAALGHHAEGEERYLVIALYYKDEAAAKADSKLIVKRMESYNLGTWQSNMEKTPFTKKYIPGEPVVKRYGDGFVLTIACRKSLGKVVDITGMGTGGFRDMLFLAPDPSSYVGINEEPNVTINK